MTKNEMIELVKWISKLYPNNKYIETEEAFNAWYEIINELDYDLARKGITNYTKYGQYPPMIADIYREYNILAEEIEHTMDRVKQEYEIAMSYYPGNNSMDTDTRQVFLDRIKQYPQNEWIPRASRFRKVTINYVQGCERSGAEIKGYREYVNEQRV